MTSDRIASEYRRYETAARGSWSLLNNRRPLLPFPEVILLLDPAGRIVQNSHRFPGERLSRFEFAPELILHDVLHGGCDGSVCQLADNWAAAWTAHKSGLPVEWYFASQAMDLALRLRLQPVSYACAILFGGSVHRYDDHSVLFIQDLTADVRSVDGLNDEDDRGDVHANQATVYRLRRATDPNPDLVASMDDRLRTITSQLLVSQEDERKRIASELHDSLGQSLSLLRLEIETCLAEALTHDGTLDVKALERTHEHTRRALEELRIITRNLRPTIINDVGLQGALDILCRDFQETRPEVLLAKELSGCDGSVPDDVAVAVYRIAQEALNNTARHAHASSASISFNADEHSYRLVISDDGCGLQSGRMPARGLGLITMRERAETLGGEFVTDCRAGKGCTIRVTWPTSVGISAG
jgi:signal transduction histidine kinase